MIDLHCHSTYSDGALTPDELIQRAIHQQIRCLSLTDHDTVSAYPDLYKAALDSGIRIINGIELSARWKKYDVHILGYQIEHTQELHALIARQNTSRIDRARKIGELLQQFEVEEAYEKACLIAGHQRAGRLHFAQVLVNEGKARDRQAAFTRFLGRGKGAYVPTPWISLPEAVAGILAAGGQAVIAHPMKYGLTRTKLHELINEFKESGGAGIEVVSGEMNVSQVREAAGLSLRFHLLASSGSDFHGDAVSRVSLGRQQALPAHCQPIWHDWNI